MRTLLIAAAATVALVAGTSAFAATDPQSRTRGGSDIGPMGQCFDASACGWARGAFAYAPGWCHMVRERIVTDDGRIIFRRHRVCP